MSAVARWCFHHRFRVIAAWVIVLIGLGALAHGVKSNYNNSFSLPGTDSTTAQHLLVAQTHTSADEAALHTLEATLPRVPGVAAATPVAARAGTKVIQVISRTSPEDKATSDLIAALRGSIIISAVEHSTMLRVYVGGVTATFADLASFVRAKLPWFLLAIIGLSFLLLVVAFRSLLIPATAAVMNLIASAAGFGILTAVFQWGWGSDAPGFGKAGRSSRTCRY